MTRRDQSRILLPGLLSVGLALAAPLSARSASTNFVWNGWQIPASPLDERSALSVVSDADAESVRETVGQDGKKAAEHVALQARVTRRIVAKEGMQIGRTPLVKWDDLAPGLYRVSARLAFDGDVGVIETPVALTIVNASLAKGDTNRPPTPMGKGVSTELYGCDVDEAGQYTVMSFLHEISPAEQGADKRLRNRGARTAYRWCYWPYTDAYPEAEAAKDGSEAGEDEDANEDEGKEVAAKKKPATPDGVMIRLSVPKQHGPCMRSIKLDWVRLQREELSPSLTVRWVRPQKIRVAPGDTNVIRVLVGNFGERAATRDLVLSMTRGLATREVVHRQAVTVEAGATNTVDIPWVARRDAPLWGYEVTAEIVSGDRVDSSAHDYFLVYPRCYPVMVQGSRSRKVDPFRLNEGYINHVEDFGILPGDMAQVCPPEGEEQWVLHMGDGAIAQSYRLCRTAIAYNRAQGISTMLYLWSGGTGRPVMDMYVKHPEWVAGRVNATDQVYEQLLKRETQVREHDFTKGPPGYQENVYHVQQTLNHIFPKLQEKIEKEMLTFLENTGYDGIRFDEGFLPPRSGVDNFGEPLGFDMRQAHSVGATNLQHFWDTLLTRHPRLELGANRDTYEYLNNEVGVRGHEPAPPNPEFAVFAKAGGMYMDEPSLQCFAYGYPMNVIEDALWAMCRRREAIRPLGGSYQLFSPNRDGSGPFRHDHIYWSVCIIMSGNLYYGGFSPPPYSRTSLGAFITRFAEFYRSPGLRTLEDVRSKIAPDVDQELWFEDTAMWEDVSERRRYVIPFINPPIVDRFMQNPTGELPAPLEPFAVEVKIPEGFRDGEAWMLTWEPDVRAERLEAKRKAAGALEVSFPGVQLCRTLVVEFSR